jgi:hypothetical protein
VEKKDFPNFDDPKEKRELVTGTKPPPAIQCFLKMWLLAPAARSHTHYMAETHREGAIPRIANYSHIRR